MKGTRKVRLSLLSAPLLSPTDEPAGRRVSISTVDSSEDEWAAMQRKLDSEMVFIEKADAEALNALKEAKIAESSENLASIRESIDVKNEEVEILQEELAEIEDRFVWDLALALKRCLVEEAGPETERGVAISCKSVSSIVEQAIEEGPLPHEWSSWITRQYIDA